MLETALEKGIEYKVALEKAKARHQPVVEPLSKELPVGHDTRNPLHYLYRGMGLYGREREMAALEDFLKPQKHLYDLSLWAVTGPGGMGKSKLVYTFAERQKEAGWTVIYLNQERLRRLLERARQMEGDEADPFRLTEEEFKRDILLVADYANLLAKDLGELTELLFRHFQTFRYRLRVLLVAREGYAPDPKGTVRMPMWYETLTAGHDSLRRQFYKDASLELGALSREALGQMLTRFADEKRERGETMVSKETVEQELPAILQRAQELSREASVRTLFCLMLADTFLAGQDYRRLSYEAVLESILDRTNQMWREGLQAQNSGDLLEPFRDMMVCATILGSCNLRQPLDGIFAESSETLSHRADENLPQLKNCLTVFNESGMGREEPVLRGMEPDIIGEFYVLHLWTRYRRTEEKILPVLQFFQGEDYVEDFLDFWEHCLSDFLYDGSPFQPFFERVFALLEKEGGNEIPVLFAMRLLFAVTHAKRVSLPERKAAAEIMGRLLEAFSGNTEIAKLYAMGLFNLTITQDEAGTAVTVEILRGMYEAFPGNTVIALRYTSGLVNLTAKQDEAGTAVTVEILREIYEAYPGNPEIAFWYARGLYDLITKQDEAGSAVTVEMLRGLHEAFPGNPEIARQYAKGLFNLSAKQDEAGSAATVETLRGVYEAFPGNPEIARQYAKGLFNLTIQQDEAGSAATAEMLRCVCAAFPGNPEIAVEYTSGLLSRMSEQDETGRAVTVEMLRGVYGDFPGNPEIAQQYAVGLVILTIKQNETGRAATVEMLRGVYGDFPGNPEIADLYASGLAVMAHRSLKKSSVPLSHPHPKEKGDFPC